MARRVQRAGDGKGVANELWDELKLHLRRLSRRYAEYRAPIELPNPPWVDGPRIRSPWSVQTRSETKLTILNPDDGRTIEIEGRNRVKAAEKRVEREQDANRQLAFICRQIEPLLRGVGVDLPSVDSGTPEGRVTWWAICYVEDRRSEAPYKPRGFSRVSDTGLTDHFTSILTAINKWRCREGIDANGEPIGEAAKRDGNSKPAEPITLDSEMEPHQRALALLVKYKDDWTIQQYADAVGVHCRTIYKSPKWETFRQARNKIKGEVRRGSKSTSGHVEAIDGD